MSHVKRPGGGGETAAVKIRRLEEELAAAKQRLDKSKDENALIKGCIMQLTGIVLGGE
jgi:hypothetical protein